MQGWMDIIQGGMTPQAAAEKAFKRVEEIFAKYPIAQPEAKSASGRFIRRADAV